MINPSKLPFFPHAVRLHQQGNLSEAEEIYQRLIEAEPRAAGALHMLGVVRLQQERFEEARELIGRAIAVDAAKAVYFNNFGAALNGLGRLVEALAAFHRAAQIRPKYADAQANIGWAYEQLGQLDEAAKHYRLALEIKPDHADALGRSLTLAPRLTNQGEAVRLCEELLKTHPTSELFTRAGNLHLAGGQTPRAVEHYEQALALEPGNAAATYNLGNALHEQHRVSEARERFQAAAALRPKQAFWKLRAAISCPAVFQSVQEIDDFCGELSATLDRWIDAPPKASPQDLLTSAAFPNFTYAYLGRNIRPLKEKVARLYAPYFRHAPQQLVGSGLAGRKRLGIVVTERHEGIFLRCMEGIVAGLNADEFEVVIFCSPSGRGRLEKALGPEEGKQPEGCTPTFVSIPSVLEEAAAVIRERRCDILYYWEVCSDALNYFLPFYRLAPVQCTSHGSQISSGNPNLDWFYSSQWMEVEAAQEHYSERLWQGEALLIKQPRLTAPPPAARGSFGLAEDRTLYMCLQNPLKLHPVFDPLLRGVLESDPSGQVVLLGGTYEYAQRDLRRRFERTLPGLQERVTFLPFQRFAAYLQLISLADVVLDPPHFGAGSSAYDVFSFDQPLVTMPTAINVGRVGTAFYERMGLPDFVSRSDGEYIERAVKLGRDCDFRAQQRERLRERTPQLFNDLPALKELERFFTKMPEVERKGL